MIESIIQTLSEEELEDAFNEITKLRDTGIIEIRWHSSKNS